MKIINDYDYVKPQQLNDALDLLATRDNIKLLAGGTDLIVYLKEELVKPELLLDVKGLPELNGIRETGDQIFIGANVTFTDLLESDLISEKLPLLWECSKTVASIGIRNRATLTGNICSAVPSLDSAPALLVYDAQVMLKSRNSERNISIHDWFTGPKRTALKQDELVLGIKLPVPLKHAGIYEKLGRYKGEDLAQAGIGIYVDTKYNYRFAACAVGPVSKRLENLEELFKGKAVSEELIDQATEMIPTEISPISDIRSSAEYRVHMMQVMFKRGLWKAVASLPGGSK